MADGTVIFCCCSLSTSSVCSEAFPLIEPLCVKTIQDKQPPHHATHNHSIHRDHFFFSIPDVYLHDFTAFTWLSNWMISRTSIHLSSVRHVLPSHIVIISMHKITVCSSWPRYTCSSGRKDKNEVLCQSHSSVSRLENKPSVWCKLALAHRHKGSWTFIRVSELFWMRTVTRAGLIVCSHCKAGTVTVI